MVLIVKLFRIFVINIKTSLLGGRSPPSVTKVNVSEYISETLLA